MSKSQSCSRQSRFASLFAKDPTGAARLKEYLERERAIIV